MSENPKAWRVFNGTRTKVQIQWEPRDMWIGVFWRKTELCFHLYVCILPLLPIHITTLLK
jgi:hypothetical protein